MVVPHRVQHLTSDAAIEQPSCQRHPSVPRLTALLLTMSEIEAGSMAMGRAKG